MKINFRHSFLSACLALALNAGAQSSFTPEYRAEAQALVEAAGMDSLIASQFIQAFKPALSGRGWSEKRIEACGRRIAQRALPVVAEALGKAYSEVLTLDEAHEVVLFYRTPTGRRFARSMHSAGAEVNAEVRLMATVMAEGVNDYLDGHTEKGAAERPSDEYAEAVALLIAEQGTEQALREAIEAALSTRGNGVPEKRRKAAADYVWGRYGGMLANRIATVYRKYYSLVDVRSQTLFFARPTGRKLGRMSPAIAAAFYRALADCTEIVTEVINEMNAEGAQ